MSDNVPYAPYWFDACVHDRPNDRFLGTVRSGEGEGVYDIFVYQDNAGSAPIPDMHLCFRYGQECSQYISPGNADLFVARLRLSKPMGGDWPPVYHMAAQLINTWIAKGRP
jgi:hypothetical protein